MEGPSDGGCFLHICIFTSQSRIQWHHNRGRQKYCWSYATQQLCENILVIDSVVYFSFLQRKLQPNLFLPIPSPPPTLPSSFSPSPHPPMLSLPASYKIYPFGRKWTWVMDQQHVSLCPNVMLCSAPSILLSPSSLTSIIWSQVLCPQFLHLFSVVSILYLFPLHLIHLLDTKTSWESIIRSLLWEIKIWYSCLFYLQGFSSVSLCVQPLEIAQGRNSTSPFGCLKLNYRQAGKTGGWKIMIASWVNIFSPT